jgi:phospholipase C
MLRSSLVTLLALSSTIAALPGKRSNNNDPDPGSWQSRIKNVVVLVQENRSFDTFAGGLDYDDDINGLTNTKYCNPTNASIPGSPIVCAMDTAEDVAPDDPNHGISGVNYEIFSTYP